MFNSILSLALVILGIATLLCFIRALLGPTMHDRIVALDTVGILLIGFVGILMMLQDTMAYTEVALVIGILAFVGSVAIAKFLERGNLFDND
ncbi:Na(+)/H(+) antiporter subunit F1 [Bacillus sp. JCM 19041]|uniref:Na(+)/H(+) antiporter subunit F1 n=1 Tax=Bacillus sp. JCM 19041 TaxID=1460637 RepID=UPI0006D0FF72